MTTKVTITKVTITKVIPTKVIPTKVIPTKTGTPTVVTPTVRTTYYTHLESPLGPLLLTSNGNALTGLYMGEHKHGPEIGTEWICDPSALPFPEATRQLAAYFHGTRTRFDLPLAPQGTPFQQQVWQELLRIPYGATLSYGELAKRVGNPRASRAVGLANGRNPLSILVPCHRIISADGKLTGYGGGTDRKEQLLRLEGACAPQQ